MKYYTPFFCAAAFCKTKIDNSRKKLPGKKTNFEPEKFWSKKFLSQKILAKAAE